MSRIGAADPAEYAARPDVLDLIDTGRGWVPNIFATMLHSPDLTAGWVGLANAVRSRSALDDRTRELVILLVAHLNASAYEWHHHRGVAERLGVTPAEIERVTNWPAGGWDEPDGWTLQLAAATTSRSEPPAGCLDALLEARGHRYTVDVAVTAAYYSAVALFTSVLAIEPETSAAARGHRS